MEWTTPIPAPVIDPGYTAVINQLVDVAREHRAYLDEQATKEAIKTYEPALNGVDAGPDSWVMGQYSRSGSIVHVAISLQLGGDSTWSGSGELGIGLPYAVTDERPIVLGSFEVGIGMRVGGKDLAASYNPGSMQVGGIFSPQYLNGFQVIDPEDPTAHTPVSRVITVPGHTRWIIGATYLSASDELMDQSALS